MAGLTSQKPQKQHIKLHANASSRLVSEGTFLGLLNFIANSQARAQRPLFSGKSIQHLGASPKMKAETGLIGVDCSSEPVLTLG